MLRKKQALEYSKLLDNLKSKTTDPQLNDVLAHVKQAKENIVISENAVKNKMDTMINETKTVRKRTGLRLLKLSAAPAVITLLFVIGILLNGGGLSANVIAAKALSAISGTSDPNKIIYLQVVNKLMDAEDNPEVSNIWIDNTNKIRTQFSKSPGGSFDSYYNESLQYGILHYYDPEDRKMKYDAIYYDPDEPENFKDNMYNIESYKQLLKDPAVEKIGEITYKGRDVYHLRISKTIKNDDNMPDERYVREFYIDKETYLPVYDKNIQYTGEIVNFTDEREFQAKFVDRKTVDPKYLEFPKIKSKDADFIIYYDIKSARKELKKYNLYYYGDSVSEDLIPKSLKNSGGQMNGITIEYGKDTDIPLRSIRIGKEKTEITFEYLDRGFSNARNFYIFQTSLENKDAKEEWGYILERSKTEKPLLDVEDLTGKDFANPKRPVEFNKKYYRYYKRVIDAQEVYFAMMKSLPNSGYAADDSKPKLGQEKGSAYLVKDSNLIGIPNLGVFPDATEEELIRMVKALKKFE